MVTSCEDKLNLEPFDALDVTLAFETKTDFENALKGAYGFLRDGNYYGGEFLLLPDAISDNLIICSEGRFSYQDYYLFNTNSNTAWFQFWRAAYDVILRTNYILENINNLADGPDKDNIMGQALALRAMAHFDLARVWSKPPQFAGTGDLGVPYVTSTDAALRPERPSVAETFTQINADFADAVSLVADDNGEGFINKAAAYGLQARCFLYQADYAAAATAATNAINNTTNGGVATITDFPLIWTDETTNGVVFKVTNTNLDGVGVGVVYNQASPDGIRSEYVPDFGLYSLYGLTDVRLSWFETSDFAGSTFNHVIKYLQRPGSDQAVVDMKVLRWSEVYLTRAEALARQGGNDAAALADLNAVRSERITGFTDPGETGAALISSIERERRLELAFEGHRLFDLKRLGTPIQRTDAGDYADGTGVNPPAESLTLPASDAKFQMPIPQEEINANPNIQPNPSNG